MKVLLAGGGTAGHINPALAIASIIKEHRPDAEFLYAGTPNGMEARLVPRENINFAPIRVSGFQRKLSVKNIGRNIRAAAYLTTAGFRAKQIIKGFSPDIVIGTGGYVSGPIVM
ncbi:MAG: glycosyltransferase, partial [Oscillospiraceae bacterium]|nr:glycosyltransferase [Oscillospiraceae bacterium]